MDSSRRRRDTERLREGRKTTKNKNKQNKVASSHPFSLSLVSQPPLPPEFIHADPTRIQQILTNLLSNAIKFTEKGSVIATFTSSPIPNSPNRVNLLFSVRDTGVGIPPEKIKFLFKMFSQVTKKKRYERRRAEKETRERKRKRKGNRRRKEKKRGKERESEDEERERRKKQGKETFSCLVFSSSLFFLSLTTQP